MITTSKLKMDLNNHTAVPVIYAMQDDRYSRNVELSLFQDGTPWAIPEDAAVLIRFSKSDGTGGKYDTLPDGTTAWTASENILTVALAPQVLTVPGAVTVTVSLLRQHLQISLFSILLNVRPIASAQAMESQTYIHVAEFLPAPHSGQPGQFLRITATSEAGHVTEVESADLEIDSSTILNVVSDHNQSAQSHPDMRQEMDSRLDTGKQFLTEEQRAQARENLGMEDLFAKTTKTVHGINLNDGVYETGRFSIAGEEYDLEGKYAFRSANYLSVEGGRTIVSYFDPADWNLNSVDVAIDVVQYDADKNIIVPRTYLRNHAHFSSSDAMLILNEDTAYIRIDYNRNGAAVYNDLTQPKIALYYLEDSVAEFVEYTTVAEETTLWIKKSRIWDLQPLRGKKIVYDGDSIAESRNNNDGGYADIISKLTGSTYINLAAGGAHLRSGVADRHCVADTLDTLPKNADLYCFQGGINDYWGNADLGSYTPDNFTGNVDASTVCGALETIFRYALTNFPGKPVCYVITHKIQSTAYLPNSAGNTFREYRDAMVGICEKYSIPYYDAFSESGLNGWQPEQNSLYMINGDGCHPTGDGYRRFYVPQLLNLFQRIMPAVQEETE